MLDEVKLSTHAQREYDAFCRKYRRAATSLQGALRAIGYSGRSRPFVPGTNLRLVETWAFGDLPAFAVYFTVNPDGIYQVEAIAELSRR